MALIILDRDGVINEDSDEFVKSPEEFIFLPGSVDAIARLYQAGHTLFVATNQSGIAREYFSLQTLDAMHQKLNNAVEQAGGKIEGIFFCPHGPDDNCDCRKPKPGLIDQILSVTPENSLQDALVIGDSIRDLQAGQQRQLKTVLVRTGKGKKSETQLAEHPALSSTSIYDSLADFTDNFLEAAA